jgi:transcriptional regulator with XRE-family HTH domain
MGANEYNNLLSNVAYMQPGNRLRDLRKRAGLTQSELADATGVSQPAISQIENGVLSMDIQWMRSFARILNCSAADLLDDDDNPDRLDDEERRLVARFRAADRAQRATLERVAEAVVPSSDEEAGGAAAA